MECGLLLGENTTVHMVKWCFVYICLVKKGQSSAGLFLPSVAPTMK